MPHCPLCLGDDERVLWRDDRLRIIRVGDEDYPGFLRVVWQAHVAEMSDLDPKDRLHMMQALIAAEETLRERMQPDKMNLASLGNMVPHLHWHVIARFRDDRHFPQPIWGAAQRESSAGVLEMPSDDDLGADLERRLQTIPRG